MSWISEDHKKIYKNALNAIYQDVSNLSSNLINYSGKTINSGYEKVKETVEYLDKRTFSNDSPIKNNNGSIMIFPDVLIKLDEDYKIYKVFLIINNEQKDISGNYTTYYFVNDYLIKTHFDSYKNMWTVNDELRGKMFCHKMNFTDYLLFRNSSTIDKSENYYLVISDCKII